MFIIVCLHIFIFGSLQMIFGLSSPTLLDMIYFGYSNLWRKWKALITNHQHKLLKIFIVLLHLQKLFTLFLVLCMASLVSSRRFGSSYVNVMNYGAVGDGKTDDSEVIPSNILLLLLSPYFVITILLSFPINK